MAYDQAQIRRYIIKSFSDQEIRTFCFDYFPGVYEDLSEGMSKGRKVELLLSHCLRRDLMPELIAALARERPSPFVDELLAQVPHELTLPFSVFWLLDSVSGELANTGCWDVPLKMIAGKIIG